MSIVAQAILLLAGAAVVFVLGALSGHRKTFPFNHLLLLKHQGLARLRQQVPAATATPSLRIGFDTTEGIADRREQLERFIWGGGDHRQAVAAWPASTDLQVQRQWLRALGSGVRAEHWRIEMDHGIDSVVLSLTPADSRQDLCVVYQQGHEGHVWHGRHVILGLLQQGYRVVALAMPLLGPNSQPTVELRRHGQVRLQEHDAFALLDADTGRSSIRFFVDPVLACLNRLQAEGYQRMAMLGSSGGGWTTTLCAALDTRITLSFPTAGSLPFDLRQQGELSDYENYLPVLYNIANYPELYIMAASGHGRKSIQILNEFDTVIWPGRRGMAYAAPIQDKVRAIGEGHFAVVVDNSWVGHGISPWALKMILQELRQDPSDSHRPDASNEH